MTLFNQISLSANYKWWVAAVFFLGLLVTVADFGEVSVAMPSISDHFGSNLATVQWLAIGNFLAISVFLLPMSRFADMVGRKKVLIVGFFLFSAGAALAGVAPNLETLISMRIVQGIALGMIQGNQMAILMSIFPSEERGKILGFQMTLVGVGLIVGPVVGGLLTGWFGWRSIFYFNFPMGILCLALIMVVVNEQKVSSINDGKTGSRFDWIGAVISAVTLIAFLIGLSNPFEWSITYRSVLLILSVVLAGGFVLWESKFSSPMLDMRLFANPLFTSSVAARIIIFLCVGPVIFLIPFYLQGVAGYTPGQAGLILMTNAIGLLVAGPIAGRLCDRYGWRIFTVGGSVCSALGLIILAGLREDTSLPVIVLGILLPSIGNGLFSAPSSTAILSVVPGSSYGIISALIQLLRNTSMVTGIAAATLITTMVMTNTGLDVNIRDITGDANSGTVTAFVSAIRTVFLAMAGLQILGAVLSLYKGKRVNLSLS